MTIIGLPGGSPAKRVVDAAADIQAECATTEITLHELKELCLVITAEMGLSVEGAPRHGRYLDLALGSTVLLRPRRVLLRLTTEPPVETALTDLRIEAVDRGCADYLLVGTKNAADVAIATSEHFLGPAGLLDVCRGSYAVGWDEGRPVPRKDAFRLARLRAEELSELDRFGLAWLPALSRDRLPWQLRDSTTPPNEWFERVVFRIATALFQIKGVRLGAAIRGQRVGDALLWWRGRVALLDCKAAHNGYRLDVDDERRLLEYVRTGCPEYGPSERIDCVLLVSSSFPTFDRERRWFTARRNRFIAAGSDLACVRADDLVDAGLAVLRNMNDTRSLDAIAWDQVLAQGLVTRTRLLAHCSRAARRR
jgi:hypothetical protein